MAASSVHLSNICFSLPSGESIFDHLSLSIQSRVSAIVGLNGVGKSLLAKIIAGLVSPNSGEIQAAGRVAYVPQAWHGHYSDTMVDILRLKKPLAAMDRIAQGSMDEADYQLAESSWDWEAKLQIWANDLQLQFEIDVRRKIADYSGGQQIQLLLLAACYHDSDIIILDEPTNHLDSDARDNLLAWVRSTDHVLVLISHDPQLLHGVDEIWELTDIGAYHFGGGYDHYRELQQQRKLSLSHDLNEIKKQQRRHKQASQSAMEKQQRRVAYGKLSSARSGRSKIEIGAAKEQAGASLSAQQKKYQARETSLATQRKQLEQKLEHEMAIAFELPASRVDSAKMILQLKNCVCGYEHALHQALNFSLQGPQRIHVHANNGVGKTTLFRTIVGELPPLSGSCKCFVEIACLDQQPRFVDETASALQVFRLSCPGMKEQDYYDRLAWIGFRGELMQKRVAHLSGGNRMKLAIACVLLGKKTPQLLLLDEPSNHLDQIAREALLQALSCYQGAMMVASHDQAFVECLACTASLPLSAC